MLAQLKKITVVEFVKEPEVVLQSYGDAVVKQLGQVHQMGQRIEQCCGQTCFSVCGSSLPVLLV